MNDAENNADDAENNVEDSEGHVDDSGNVDHWNLLAGEVGAEVPPPTTNESQSDAEAGQSSMPTEPNTSQPLPKAAAKKPPRREPAPTPSHWGNLVGELGLEVPPELLEEPAQEEELEVEEVEEIDPAKEPALFDEDRSGEQPDKGPELTLFGEPDDNPDADAGTDASEPIEFDPLAMWDQPQSLVSAPVEAVREARPSEPETDMFDAARETADDDAEEEAAGEEDASKDESSEDEPPKRGRRRRRRRRSGERPEEGDRSEQPEKEEVVVKSEEVESDDDDDDDDDADDHDSDDDQGNTSRRSRQSDETGDKHRKIPTWSDAIGVVVQANIDSRSRPPSPRRGRGRGRSGGNRS